MSPQCLADADYTVQAGVNGETWGEGEEVRDTAPPDVFTSKGKNSTYE